MEAPGVGRAHAGTDLRRAVAGAGEPQGSHSSSAFGAQARDARQEPELAADGLPGDEHAAAGWRPYLWWGHDPRWRRRLNAGGSDSVIAPSAVRAVPAPGSGGTLRLAGSVVVRPGDVLASGVGDAAPSGFLLKATASRSDGGDTLVDVVPATLLEAMPEGHIDEHLTLQPTAGGIRGRRPDGERIPFRKVVTCGAGGSVTIEGSADLGSPEVDLSADWGRFSLKPKSVQATALVTASAHAAASASGSASCSVGPISLFKTKLAPITFTLGVFPVVLVPEISIDLSGLGQIDADVSTSVDASLTARAGARYADGELSPIAEVEKTFEHEPPDPHASARLAATLTSELEVSAYGVGGPEFEFNAGLEMNADPDAEDPWWTLDAPISLTAGLEIDVLNIDAGPITVFEKSFRVAEAAPRDPQYRIVAGELAASVPGAVRLQRGRDRVHRLHHVGQTQPVDGGEVQGRVPERIPRDRRLRGPCSRRVVGTRVLGVERVGRRELPCHIRGGRFGTRPPHRRHGSLDLPAHRLDQQTERRPAGHPPESRTPRQ